MHVWTVQKIFMKKQMSFSCYPVISALSTQLRITNGGAGKPAGPSFFSPPTVSQI